MPRKKTSDSKAEFIRSLPITMPVEDVIAKAKENGIDMKKSYIQVTRSGMRKLQKVRASARKQNTDQQELPFEAGTATQVALLVRAMGPVKAKARLGELVDVAVVMLKAVGA